mgnify:CR=1 FL=1
MEQRGRESVRQRNMLNEAESLASERLMLSEKSIR